MQPRQPDKKLGHGLAGEAAGNEDQPRIPNRRIRHVSTPLSCFSKPKDDRMFRTADRQGQTVSILDPFACVHDGPLADHFLPMDEAAAK